MPEANVLYAVTAVVVLGLLVWVATVLRSAKEPWAREAPAASGGQDAPTVDPDAARESKREDSARSASPSMSSLPSLVVNTSSDPSQPPPAAGVAAPKSVPRPLADDEPLAPSARERERSKS